MITDGKTLAVILARKNSKRVPHKNIVNFGGKPLVEWTIKAAVEAKRVDRTIVSTDDPDVRKVAEESGVKDIIDRPAALAADNTPASAAMDHVLERYAQDKGEYPAHIVLLQPTSPLRTASDVDRAMDQYLASGAESLVTACVIFQHPVDGVLIPEGQPRIMLKDAAPVVDENTGMNRLCYWINGAVYITSTERYLRTRSFVDKNTELMLMPQSRSIDIDTPFDLELARAVKHFAEHVNPGILQL